MALTVAVASDNDIWDDTITVTVNRIGARARTEGGVRSESGNVTGSATGVVKRPVNNKEIIASNGSIKVGDVAFLIPTDNIKTSLNVAITLRPNDRITDDDGVVWTILSVADAHGATRVFCRRS